MMMRDRPAVLLRQSDAAPGAEIASPSVTAETARARRRILVIVENMPVPLDRRVWQEAQALRDAGYEVSVICPRTAAYPVGFEVIDGIAIYRHPLLTEARGLPGYILEYSSALFWQFVLSVRVLSTRGFDVIHACNPPDTIFLVAAVFKGLFGKRFVFDHHDLAPELFLHKFADRRSATTRATATHSLVYRLLLVLERSTMRLADKVIANNPEFARIAVERGGKRGADVAVVRSGPDLRRMHPIPVRRDYRRGRRHLAAYVGIMGSQDGVDLLLRAVHHLVDVCRCDDVHFLLIGAGPEFESLQALATELGIAGHVTFTGYLGGDDLLEALSAADLGICPDPKNEMNDKLTMNKILEYMSCGLPVVMFDLAEGRRLAGDCAVYASGNDPRRLAERIAELLDCPERRRGMGESGRERVRLFSWEHEQKELLRTYAALCG
jgi:glycosyltransferase involved in cell wall biosynthesis